MKRFLFNLFIFSIPVSVSLVLIFVLPVNKDYAYAFVNKGGCEGRSAWIYHRIFEDTTSIDVAFVGTSHTMSAVNDELIERQFNDSNKTNYHFANLAYCGFGRNFDYVITQDLLSKRKVKLLILEFHENESQSGHGSFAHVANYWDVINAPMAFNRSYLPDIYKTLLLHIQYIRETLTGEGVLHKVDFSNSEYGFNGSPRIESATLLAEIRRQHSLRSKPMLEFIENGFNSYPMKYVSKIKELADKNNVKLVLLYLPEYGNEYDVGRIQKQYGKYGPIILPTEQILENVDNWYDPGHLNLSGASQLTPIIADGVKL